MEHLKFQIFKFLWPNVLSQHVQCVNMTAIVPTKCQSCDYLFNTFTIKFHSFYFSTLLIYFYYLFIFLPPLSFSLSPVSWNQSLYYFVQCLVFGCMIQKKAWFISGTRTFSPLFFLFSPIFFVCLSSCVFLSRSNFDPLRERLNLWFCCVFSLFLSLSPSCSLLFLPSFFLSHSFLFLASTTH